MSDGIASRQLGTGHQAALTGLSTAATEWVVPFLQEWIAAGAQPIVSDEEDRYLSERIEEWSNSRSLPEGYHWLPEFLKRIATGMRFNRRNFVNIHPTPHVPSVLASAAVALQNPNNIVEDVSGPTTVMERESIAWIAQHLIGFDPAEAWGNVVSGGTLANTTALLVARDYCYRKLARPRPVDVRSRGLYGLPPGVVLATAGSHYSIRKALWLLGMGDENVVQIPVAFDELMRRDAERDRTYVRGITDTDWRALIDEAIARDAIRGAREMEGFYRGDSQPFSLQPLDSQIYKALYSCFEYGTPLIAYVFTLGTTDTGTIEQPSSEALRKLMREDVFIHADAAAGGFTFSHPRVRERLAGLDRVHSVTLDGHKFGHLAYPNAAIVFRDRGWSHEILHEAPYLRNLAPTLEGSRPGSHVAALWAAIQDLGTTGYNEWLDHIFAFVDRLVEAFESSGRFQILNKIDLTTLAIVPLPRQGESRRELNDTVRKMHCLINSDASEHAFLVNVDRGLAGVKVSNSNVFRSEAALEDADSLVDVHCLRIVVTNPAVIPEDGPRLVEYLDHQLSRARGG